MDRDPAAAATDDVSYSFSPQFAARLAQLDVAIAFSSYQSGFLYTLGRKPQGGMHLHRCAIGNPMGLSYHPQSGLTVAAGHQILRMQNALNADQQVDGLFDVCFVPRVIHLTGALDAHDVGLGADGAPVFVNTQYNCLATTDARHSFRAVWRPDFISALVREDRCHLNGLAMDGTRPAFVSAVSRSDTIDGWRDRRADGGVIIDIAANRIVCDGLSMPHSPRLHQGQLWVLNSGSGELGVIEGAATGTGRFVPKAFCPGFLRGLALHRNYAVVGLSKPRHQRFEGLALDARRATDQMEGQGRQPVARCGGVGVIACPACRPVAGRRGPCRGRKLHGAKRHGAKRHLCLFRPCRGGCGPCRYQGAGSGHGGDRRRIRF